MAGFDGWICDSAPCDSQVTPRMPQVPCRQMPCHLGWRGIPCCPKSPRGRTGCWCGRKNLRVALRASVLLRLRQRQAVGCRAEQNPGCPIASSGAPALAVSAGWPMAGGRVQAQLPESPAWCPLRGSALHPRISTGVRTCMWMQHNAMWFLYGFILMALNFSESEFLLNMLINWNQMNINWKYII